MPESFDEQLRRKLEECPGGDRGRDLASAYEQAQSYLKSHVYDYIRTKVPYLTDHGTNHVLNVQSNVSKLLSKDGKMDCLSGTEMYCTGMKNMRRVPRRIGRPLRTSVETEMYSLLKHALESAIPR